VKARNDASDFRKKSPVFLIFLQFYDNQVRNFYFLGIKKDRLLRIGLF